MVKMSFSDNQVALEYAIYMIVGSYFRKTEFKNSLLEKKMRLQYKEQKLNDQYLMEEECIRYCVKVLAKQLPKKLWRQEMEIRIKRLDKDLSQVQFRSSDYILCITGSRKNKKITLSHELWVKGTPAATPKVEKKEGTNRKKVA